MTTQTTQDSTRSQPPTTSGPARDPLVCHPRLGAPAEIDHLRDSRSPVDDSLEDGSAVRNPKPGHYLWVLLLPLMCCGGPALIAIAASAGALGWGAIGAAIAAAVTAAVLLGRRRAGHSCAVPSVSAPRSRPAPAPGSPALRGATPTGKSGGLDR